MVGEMHVKKIKPLKKRLNSWQQHCRRDKIERRRLEKIGILKHGMLKVGGMPRRLNLMKKSLI